jgi:16S rRNA (guanine527-N7)-methyltransferase
LGDWFPELSESALNQLRVFHAELLQFNGRINLIASTSERHADQVHFADSILGLRIVLSATPSAVIHDLGSGNGFPGLVGAAMAPDRRWVLVERDGRKAEFLKHALFRMGLKNVEVRAGRVEDLGAGAVQAAVSRGFAAIGKALLLSQKSFLPGGMYFHFKSEAWVGEVAELSPQLLGVWSVERIGGYETPDYGPRFSVIRTSKRA